MQNRVAMSGHMWCGEQGVWTMAGGEMSITVHDSMPEMTRCCAIIRLGGAGEVSSGRTDCKLIRADVECITPVRPV